MNNIEAATLYLCRCVLNSTSADASELSDIDLDSLYKFCEYHSVTAMICYALESAGIKHQQFLQAKEKAIRKNLLLDTERKRIQKFLNEEHIWNMPLKGVVLKELYPRLGMRQMSDNDILFDAEKRSEVSAFMKKSGYELLNASDLYCKEWLKKPVYNFEMHFALFAPGGNAAFYKYYKDIFSKLIRIDNDGYEYKFSDEDFYLYTLAHAYKHYCIVGSGIRTLIDFYVYLTKKGDQLDWEYISAELEKLGLTDYEALMRNTALHTFGSGSELSTKEEEALEYMIGSGTYGTNQNFIKKSAKLLKADNKAEYVFRRIFPNMAFFRKYYPITEKYPFLVPFVWVYRMIHALLHRGDLIKSEVSAIKTIDNDDLKK